MKLSRICWSSREDRPASHQGSWAPVRQVLLLLLLTIWFHSLPSVSNAVKPTPSETWASPWRPWGPRSWVCLGPRRSTGSRPPRCGRELTGWEYPHQRKRPAPSPGLMTIFRCRLMYCRSRRYSYLYFLQGLRSSEKERDLSQQGLEGVQDPQLNSLQDCTQRGNRTCSAIQRSGDRLESGETHWVRDREVRGDTFCAVGWSQHCSGGHQRRDASTESCCRVR